MNMHNIRTNQSLHISQLIPELLMHFNVLNGTGTFPPADEQIKATSHPHKVEEGDPVRSAERVPYSSSHHLARERSASSIASVCTGTTDPAIEVAAA